MKNKFGQRAGQKIKLTSVDELLGVSNEETALDLEMGNIYKRHEYGKDKPMHGGLFKEYPCKSDNPIFNYFFKKNIEKMNS